MKKIVSLLCVLAFLNNAAMEKKAYKVGEPIQGTGVFHLSMGVCSTNNQKPCPNCHTLLYSSERRQHILLCDSSLLKEKCDICGECYETKVNLKLHRIHKHKQGMSQPKREIILSLPGDPLFRQAVITKVSLIEFEPNKYKQDPDSMPVVIEQ